MTFLRIVPLLLLVSSFGPEFCQAKIGFRQLTSIYPVAVQRGTSTTVRLRSNFTLDNTYAVFFDKPGVRMTFAETEPIKAPRKGRASVGTPFRFQVDVPDDQQTGVYELRLATRQAVSSISHLLVTDFPVTEEKAEANDGPDAAQPFTVPAAICGVCERNEDVDCFRFSGVQGQRISIQVYAQRVTESIHIMLVRHPIYHMDPILTLLGPNGQVIAENDNVYGADSFLHCQLPESGEYTVKIRDVRYAGSEKYSYCIEVSDRPFVQAVFPMALQRGSEIQSEAVGFGTDDVPLLNLTAGDSQRLGWQTVRAHNEQGRTNEAPLLISPYPQYIAGAGSDSLETASPITIPCGVSGRLATEDAAQFFAFDAKEGRHYLFEVEAHRHALPLDSVLEIFDTNGKRLAEQDDTRGSPYAGRWYQKDSKLYFKAPRDEKYFVVVRDLHGRGGKRFVYYLRAESSGGDFELFGEYYYAMLAPGTRMLWFARVNRLNGFAGPIELGVEGLPSGVELTPATIPAGMDHCALVLSAKDDAEIDAGLVRVFGKAQVAGPDGERQDLVRYGNVTCELQSGGGSSQTRWPCKTQIVGVTEPLDLARVEASPTEITLEPGGRVEINIRIIRDKGNSDPVTLAMRHMYYTNSCGDQLPPGVTMATGSRTQLKGDESEAVIILEASPNALTVQRLPIAVMARVYVTYNISTNYASTPIQLTVTGAK